MQQRLLLCAATLPIVAAIFAQTSATPSAIPSATAEKALLDQYCVVCHNLKAKAAGMEPARKLTLDNLDVANVEKDSATWEVVVRKLRAGMMPPSGMPRPKPANFETIITYLENELDKHAESKLPPPGLHRLNRTEY